MAVLAVSILSNERWTNCRLCNVYHVKLVLTKQEIRTYMSLINAIKSFFKATNVDPVAVAIYDRFTSANDAFDVQLGTTTPFSTRAINRYAIYANAEFTGEQAEAYAEVVAAITDPTDFEPYTEAELDAHTSAIDNFTTAFDDLTAAFEAFSTTDIRYKSAAALYDSSFDIFKLIIEAYSHAVFCALLTALKDNIQSSKEDWKLTLLGPKATPDLKAKVDENANKAKQLEQKARIAETKVELLFTKEASVRKKRTHQRTHR